MVDTIGAGDAFTAGFVTWWRGSGRGRDHLGDVDALTAGVAPPTPSPPWSSVVVARIRPAPATFPAGGRRVDPGRLVALRPGGVAAVAFGVRGVEAQRLREQPALHVHPANVSAAHAPKATNRSQPSTGSRRKPNVSSETRDSPSMMSAAPPSAVSHRRARLR